MYSVGTRTQKGGINQKMRTYKTNYPGSRQVSVIFIIPAITSKIWEESVDLKVNQMKLNFIDDVSKVTSHDKNH